MNSFKCKVIQTGRHIPMGTEFIVETSNSAPNKTDIVKALVRVGFSEKDAAYFCDHEKNNGAWEGKKL